MVVGPESYLLSWVRGAILIVSITYDIVTVGGGLGGAAIARSLAEHGVRVLVLEQETRSKDRVRGEWLAPWGTVEARTLGIYDAIMAAGGHEVRWWDSYQGSKRVAHRDLVETSSPGVPSVTFYHPKVQEALLEAAANAGAEVRLGARVKSIKAGTTPTVLVEVGGREVEVHARLVVGADGRASKTRRWAGFKVQKDADQNLIAGVLLDGIPASDDTAHVAINPALGLFCLIFPQGHGRVRAYVCYPCTTHYRLSGADQIARFVEDAIKGGEPGEYYSEARVAGPLATFHGAVAWVRHPYGQGVALIGDAAAASDPTWGQGLSLAIKDARVLRDQLLQNHDWDEAGHAYAGEHDRYYEATHTMESWMTQMMLQMGAEGDALRARALPLWKEDRSRNPDTFISGPDQPLDGVARSRFFGED